MFDFRRVVTALAVLALLTGFCVTASAQLTTSVQCAVSVRNQPTLRAEGITELIGDLLVTCTNNAAAPAGVAAFSVFVGPGTPTLTSRTGEAVLVKDPGTGVQQTIAGTISGNSISFNSVPVNPAGSAQTTYLITNVRVNASAIGATGGFGQSQVLAFVTASGFTPTTPVTVTNAGTSLLVGVVQTGLNFSVRTAANDDTSSGLKLQQCNQAKSTNTGLTLRYQEGFASAFKTQAQESGNTTFAAAAAATTGTRLRAVFQGLPAGTSVYVATTNSGATGTNTAVLVPGETGPLFSVPSSDTINSIPVFKLAVDANGNAEAVWEVTAAAPDAANNLDFPIFFSASAGGATAAQQGKVSGSFAPVSSTTSASDTAPVPRFVDLSTPKNVVIFNICRTSLLFPFVTAANGFDTGIAIANTTADGGTTTPQSGKCVLNFFGASAPSAFTSDTVAGGSVFVGVLSTLAPGFQGYMIATCDFQDGHGFAFVQSTVGYTPSTAAMGYLALVLPRLNAGESLGF